MLCNFASFNCSGCCSPSRNALVLSVLLSFQFDIVFLQETNVRSDEPSRWFSWPFFFFHSFSEVAVGGGVSIALRPSLLRLFPDIAVLGSLAGHFLHVRLRARDCCFHLFNVYIPQSRSLCSTVMDFLVQSLSSVPPSEALIVGGDFNCTFCPELDRSSGVEPRSALAKRLSRLFASFDLVDAFRSVFPEACSFTRSSRGRQHAAATRIDRFYVSPFFLPGVSGIFHYPTSVSDHALVHLVLSFSFALFPLFKWSFDTSFLLFPTYVSLISSALSCSFSLSDSPGLHWIFLKAHLRTLSVSFCHAHGVRRAVSRARLQALADSASSSASARAECLAQLQLSLDDDARKAARRCLHDRASFVDCPSQLFLALERSRRRSSSITILRSDSGVLITDRARLCTYVRDYYAALFSPSVDDPVFSPDLLSTLPRLSSSACDSLEGDFTPSEIKAAIASMKPGKMSGPDGLPAEFYQTFLTGVLPFLTSAFNCLPSHVDWLPFFLVAQISLLPKKTDLRDLRNWRPICVTNADYKIMAKVLAARLGLVVCSIVAPAQTYSVKGRSLYDNLHILRSLLFLANARSEELALFGLDQEKAYDRVGHRYLWTVLRAFGVGPRFLSFVSLLYSRATARVSGGSFLTADFPFRRGVRQGCPLSSLLFILALEPFLHLLHNTFLQFRLSRLLSLPVSFRISYVAFADDIVVLVRDLHEFVLLENCFSVYAAASGARLNRFKCSGLWCGPWRHQPSSPWGTAWSSDGLVVLGVPLGTPAFCRSTLWDPVLARVQSRVATWTRLRDFLSLRQRALVCNTYFLSLLLHFCHIHSPPVRVVRRYERLVCRFFWNRVAWVSLSKMMLPVDAGGLQLFSLSRKVLALRVHHLADIVLQRNVLLSDVVHEVFSRVRHGLPLLVLMRQTCHAPRRLAVGRFYHDCLAHWYQMRFLPRFTDDPLFEPLFCSSVLPPPSSMFPVVPSSWTTDRVQVVRDLLLPDGSWRAYRRVGVRPYRWRCRNNRVFWSLLRASLIRRFPRIFSSTGCRLPTPLPDSPSLFSFTLDARSFDFSSLSSRFLYSILQSRLSVTPTILPSSSPSDSSFWRRCRPSLSRGREADVQWRLLHGALPTAPKLFLFRRKPNALCSFCSFPSSVLHEYLDCPILSLVLLLARRFAASFCGTFHTSWEYLSLSPAVSCPSSFSPASRHTMCTFLFVLLKYVIYSFRVHSPVVSVPQARADLPHRFFQAFLSRANFEFYQASRSSRESSFFRVWDPGGRLFLPRSGVVTWRRSPVELFSSPVVPGAPRPH